MKNHEAHLEIQNIECHLRNMVTPEQLKDAGATITRGRPPHIRVMRVISYLQERSDQLARAEKEIARLNAEIKELNGYLDRNGL